MNVSELECIFKNMNIHPICIKHDSMQRTQQQQNIFKFIHLS